jgi:hypothetical protein
MQASPSCEDVDTQGAKGTAKQRLREFRADVVLPKHVGVYEFDGGEYKDGKRSRPPNRTTCGVENYVRPIFESSRGRRLLSRWFPLSMS